MNQQCMFCDFTKNKQAQSTNFQNSLNVVNINSRSKTKQWTNAQGSGEFR